MPAAAPPMTMLMIIFPFFIDACVPAGIPCYAFHRLKLSQRWSIEDNPDNQHGGNGQKGIPPPTLDSGNSLSIPILGIWAVAAFTFLIHCAGC